MTADDSLPELEIDAKGRAIAATEAEVWLLKELNTGHMAVVSDGPNVSSLEDWTRQHTIRAEFLRHLCLEPERYGINASGINLSGALINGQLDLSDALLECPIRINATRFNKAPILRDANTRDLYLTNCYLPGLSADNLNVTGDLHLYGNTFNDHVHLVKAKISGDLVCYNAVFEKSDGSTFNARNLIVEGRFSWGQLKAPYKGTLILMQAQVGEFINDVSGWPESGKLWIDGFVYKRLDRGLSIADHIEWIRLMPNSRGGNAIFLHQPWQLARKVFRDEGDLDSAQEISLAYDEDLMQFRQRTAFLLFRPLIWLWNLLYKNLAGYGHRLFRVIPYMLAVIALFSVWSFSAYHSGYIVPAKESVYMAACYPDGIHRNLSCIDGWEEHERKAFGLLNGPPMWLPKNYPAFHSGIFTIDTFVPFADLHQENFWTVSDDGPWGEVHRGIFLAFIILGGVMSAIFAAGLLSLIKRD